MTHTRVRHVSEAISEMIDVGHINEQNRNCLLVDQPKAGKVYVLPKIHKVGNPGRPTVSANGHPTEKISKFVDLHLQPHVQNQLSYLKDSTRARELTDNLCKRCYQKQDFLLAIERARQQKREGLLSYRPKSESSVLPFVLTYHPDLPKVRDIDNTNTGPSLSPLAL